MRERRDDLGRLLVSFLRKELGVLGFAERLAPTDRPWLGAELVARLARHALPGNIRELRNLARQLVAECADRSTAVLPASFEQRWQTVAVGSTSGREEAPRPRRRGYRNPATVEGDELLDSLRRHRHNLKATAADLGVSRTSLYKLIEEHPEVRTAAELGPVEIRRALDEAEGDIGRASRQLEVSERALKQRLSQLDDTD